MQISYHNITSHHITSHHITSHHITSHHITSHHITSHHITSHHITSHHITSHHITSHHITSHHITSHHITSHHICKFDTNSEAIYAIHLFMRCPCIIPVMLHCHGLTRTMQRYNFRWTFLAYRASSDTGMFLVPRQNLRINNV